MFKLDDNLLNELGLGNLPVAEKNKMLAHIYDTLELRVGMKLAEQMSDAQLNEFEAMMPEKHDNQAAISDKEKQAFAWLESNFPHYKEVVADELEKLKSEIKSSAPQIIAATMEALHASQGKHHPKNT